MGFSRNHNSLYSFQSAKKIYFTQTPSKYYLVEKKDMRRQAIRLSTRKTSIFQNGIPLYQK